MKKIFLILITTIIFSACVGISTYNNLKTEYSYLKFNNKPNKTKGLFNINGCYKETDNNNFTSYFMFFEDGSYTHQVFFDTNNNIIGYSTGGVYQLYGDTIIVQMIDKGVGLTVSSYAEIWFKIIDKNTLKLIYFAMETTTIENFKSISYLKPYDLSKYKSLYATFIPLDSIPEFNNGLKRDKFFWEDEKDWKEYMDSLKLEKKKNE